MLATEGADRQIRRPASPFRDTLLPHDLGEERVGVTPGPALVLRHPPLRLPEQGDHPSTRAVEEIVEDRGEPEVER